MISLVGYRGTGKTTVAKLLAERLGCEWADADVVLEEQSGRTIADIFAKDGESHFRDLESNVLAGFVSKYGQDARRSKLFILATGGGVILREENRKSLREAGPVIWLTAPTDVIHERISTDPTTGERRPNLTAGGGLEEIKEVLAARENFYREVSHHVVDTNDKSPTEIAAEIEGRLKGA